MAVQIRLDLERIEALPLDPAARATLWRELLQRQASDLDSNAQAWTMALERRLFAAELDRCSRLCLEGDWLQGSRRIEMLQGLAIHLGEEARLGERLIELLTALHGLLVNRAEVTEASSSSALADSADPARSATSGERAELLWQAHRWQQLIASLPVGIPERLAVIGEQITREGAIAWHTLALEAAPGSELLQALRRSMTLLLQVAGSLDPCPAWIRLSLRQGLQLALLDAAEARPAPAELLRWARGYVDHGVPPEARDAARQRLWPAEAALEVGQALRIGLFTG